MLQAFCALESNDMRRTIADLVENIASRSTSAAPVPERRATAGAPAPGHFA
jgi:hypothetical protein